MYLKTKIFSTVWLVTLFCFLVSAVPVSALTIAEEKELGEEFLKQVKQVYRFVDDPFVDDYINRLGRRLLAAFPEQSFDYRFYVIDNAVYNAFAAPGGYVFVHSGLINAMGSEDELAGILSHEIAHVYCRHISERIEKSKKLSLATLAGITAGLFLGSGALAIGSAAAGQAAGLAYSRQDERQADEIGVQYLAAAGYSAEGLLLMLKKINEKHWFTEQEVPTYLTTHPGTEERIVYIDTLLASDRYRPGQPPAENTAADFKMAHTIVTASSGDSEISLKQMKIRLDQNDKDPLNDFGYALALSRKARHEEAIGYLKKALEKQAAHPQILTTLAIEYVLTGYYDKAMETFKKVPQTPYWDFKKQLYWSQAAEETGHMDECISILEALIKKTPDYIDAYYALGMAYGKSNNEAKAHYYLGRYYYEIDHFKNAMFHLQKAHDLTTDPEIKKDTEEKIKEVKKEGRRSPRTEPESFTARPPFLQL
ncbi:MAG: M48 family metalloprotease [Thermodesulfobacteriota bacterium]